MWIVLQIQRFFLIHLYSCYRKRGFVCCAMAAGDGKNGACGCISAWLCQVCQQSLAPRAFWCVCISQLFSWKLFRMWAVRVLAWNPVCSEVKINSAVELIKEVALPSFAYKQHCVQKHLFKEGFAYRGAGRRELRMRISGHSGVFIRKAGAYLFLY